MFLAGRCEFFRSLLEHDHFGEAERDEESGLPCFRLLGFSHSVFRAILRFLYTDHCELTLHTVSDVLEAADLCLLPRLRVVCDRFLRTAPMRPDNEDVFLRIAQLHNLSWLCDLIERRQLQRVLALQTDMAPKPQTHRKPVRPITTSRATIGPSTPIPRAESIKKNHHCSIL